MDPVVCYCFGYTLEDIKKDVLENGRSLIMQKIIEEKRAGACRCSTCHPRGV
jgi:hypothetical protein